MILGDIPVKLNNRNATLGDLKKFLDEDEVCVAPERQRMFYMGYEIGDDSMKIKDITKPFGNNMFSLVLPRARGPGFTGPSPSQRFLITGNENTMIIQLT